MQVSVIRLAYVGHVVFYGLHIRLVYWSMLVGTLFDVEITKCLLVFI